MTREPVLVSWSGGKDALLALKRLRADHRFRVTGLLTSIGATDDRVTLHGVPLALVEAQAARVGLPLRVVRIDTDADNATYEAAMAAALAAARRDEPDLATVVFGDLFLADIRAWREQQLAKAGWRAQFPLWGESAATLARAFVDRGHRAVLCCVDTQQLDAAFCGRDYDADLLADLPPSCDPCGENGEFHTFVHAAPSWSAPIALRRGACHLRDGRFAQLELGAG